MKKMLAITGFALTITLALSACGTSVNETTKKTTASTPASTPTYNAETFFETTSYFGSSFSKDGNSVLIGSDETGVYNLYQMDIASGKKTPITQSKETSYAVSYFPNDNRVLMTRDNGGDELFHLFVIHKDGEMKDLTPGEKVRARFINFSKDGKNFFVSTNERDAKFMDLYRYSSTDYQRELVYKNTQGLQVSDISPNGRFVSLAKTNTSRDSDTYLLDLGSKSAAPVLVTKHTNPAQYEPMGFSADSSRLYYGTDAKSEFTQVWHYDINSKEHGVAVASDWDIKFIYFSDSGRYQVTGINQDASTVIEILDTTTGKKLAMPALGDGDLRGVNFSADESQIAFYLNSDTSPSNLFVWSLKDVNAKQLTKALSIKINSKDLVASEIVRFKSFDELEIPGLLFKPKSASKANKVPAIIFVHGGPGGQSRTGYSAMRQHLVNHGYAVFAVNNRGSNGYGKTFYHLDDKNHGEGDLQDMVYGKKHLQSLDWIDGDKIGIMGGSYGGYMTAAALAFTPEEFEVGINIFGVTNWVRTLNSIPPWWESFKAALYDEMGDPATDAERHRAISPLFHAHQITKPLLVVQGANDPRVLQIESDELVAKVKENGVPVEYVLFDDEGHGFSKKKNRITAQKSYIDFLNLHLKK